MASWILWAGCLSGWLAALAWWRSASPPGMTPGARDLPPLWVRWVASLPPQPLVLAVGGRPDRLAALLAQAGHPLALTPEIFAGFRTGLLVLAALAGALLWALGLPIAFPLLALAGAMGPIQWLRRRARYRQRSLARALPDLLDAVACTLAAGGVGVDQALACAASCLEGPLAQEIERTYHEIALGVPRPEAFRRLLARVPCPELSPVVDALIQSDMVGAPVASALSAHAQSLRVQQAHQARSAAAAAEARMTLLAATLVAPSALLFLLGLLVLNLIHNPAFRGWLAP